MGIHFLLLCFVIPGYYASSCDFRCDNGHCIPKHYICDKYDDCPNREDEKFCYGTATMRPNSITYAPCTEAETKCHDGKCIPTIWLCDRHSDCSDGEDEANCTDTTQAISTTAGPEDLSFTSINGTCVEFTCGSEGKCIPNRWLCDGYADCTQGEDELNCPSTAKPDSPSPSCDTRLCSACINKQVISSSGCPRDFVEFKGTCLWINAYPSQWKVANNRCQQRGSRLVELPYSKLKLRQFSKYLKENTLDGLNYWVGAVNNAVNTTLDERPMDIPSWILNGGRVQAKEILAQPSQTLSSECHYLDHATPEIYINPNCGDYASFICEWENPEDNSI